MNYSRGFAEFIRETSFELLPEEVKKAAKSFVFDLLGVILAGSRSESGRIMRRREKMKMEKAILGFLFAILFSLINIGAATSQDLLEGAKKEGEMNLYLASPVEEGKMLLAAFNKKYPFIKTDFYRSPAFRLDEKFKTEVRAGKIFADVMYTSLRILNEYKRTGLLTPYHSPSHRGMYQGTVEPDGYWAAVRYNTTGIVVNSQLVPKNLWPVDWTDFIDAKPEWKGKLMTTDPTVAGAAYSWLYAMKQKYGLETCRKIIEGVRKADATVMLAYADGMNKIVTGERTILVNMMYDYYKMTKDKGAPVEYVYPKSGIVAYGLPLGLVKNCPHPNAGKLFIDFVLSQEAQTLLAQKQWRYPSRPGIELPPDLVSFEKINVISVDEMAAEREQAEMWDMWKKAMGR